MYKRQGFDIELGGETYSVDMELAEETDEEGSTLYDYAFSLDGEEVDFTDVLQQLEALSSTGSAEGVSTALGEEIAFTFHRDSENLSLIHIWNSIVSSSIWCLSSDRVSPVVVFFRPTAAAMSPE